MSIIEELDNEASWTSFLAYKKEKGHLLARDEESLVSLIASKGYLPVVRSIREGVALAPPEKLLINKMGTAKKRTVYCFESDVMWVLKHLAWLLYRFDDKQPEGCYSFRRNFGAHRAFKDIIKTRGINAHWCCKLDISDYFNSIDVALMLPILEQALADDAALYGFFEQFLCADAAFFNGELIAEKRGVMAGTPTAPFLANLYLGELDRLFVGRGLPYARYSDDIIVFAQSQAEVLSCREDAIRIIEGNGLRINERKSFIAAPGQAWEFLGMSYHEGTIDLSAATKAKLKGKIRRKARALRRWMARKGATELRAQRAFIRSFNRKFYESGGANDLTWSRWFFPLITTSESIREIDRYLQQYVRYIATGRFNGANFRVGYADLKAMGYRSLVHEYYRDRKARLAGRP